MRLSKKWAIFAGVLGRQSFAEGCKHVAALTALVGLLPTVLRAEHAQIQLLLKGREGQVEASADQEPPLGGVNPRPSLKVKAGEPMLFQFFLTNVYPHGVVDGVKVRYYVVPIDRAGQKDVPPPEKAAAMQGEVTMNFKPKCRVGARVRWRAPQPGLYLVRLDTQKTDSDHEHFAAVELTVE